MGLLSSRNGKGRASRDQCRSSGTINVQVIMSLGGGGHFTNAATQLEGVTVEETKQRLLAAIKENRNQLYDKE